MIASNSPIHFKFQSMKRDATCAAFLIGLLSPALLSQTTRGASDPVWWTDRADKVINSAAESNNHGPANVGQAKWTAHLAVAALHDYLPAIADEIESDLTGSIVPSWDAPVAGSETAKGQYAPLRIGQLKALAAPFYKRLNDEGGSYNPIVPSWLAEQRLINGTNSAGSIYPWTASTSNDANSAIATIGQVKAVFALRYEAILDHAIRSGFDDYFLGANDDASTSAVSIGFEVSLFGNSYDECYVNNNGNITFGSALETYTPQALSVAGRPIIAPFWADVDTSGSGSHVTTYSNRGSVGGRPAFMANWVGVGYYQSHADKLNKFQLVLIDRSDTGSSNFDMEYNYDSIRWDTGDVSGGIPAHCGLSNGSDSAIELAYSGQPLVQLDANPTTMVPNTTTGLIYRSRNSTVPGRFVFQVRDGQVLGAITISAGPDQSLGSSTTATLAGSASDPASGSLTLQWSVVSGTASEVTFSNSTIATPNVTFTAGHSYTLQLLATSTSDPTISVSSTMRINP